MHLRVDISAETVAQLEVALREGNREELLRLLRVAHVDAAAAEQALALIAAGGPVGDVAGAAQRLKEVRTAIAYALTHRVKPEIAVGLADAVRPRPGGGASPAIAQETGGRGDARTKKA